MKASELRIGSHVYVNVQNETWTNGRITAVHEDSVYVNGIKAPVSYLQPIPLTEQWLKRFGFDNNSWCKRIETPHFELNQDLTIQVLIHNLTSGASVYAFSDGDIVHFNGQIAEIHYVHQLQNLFFALTGEELTMKEQKTENA